MAQEVLVQLVDDLDGELGEDVSTFSFSLDGVSYEIDLREERRQAPRQPRRFRWPEASRAAVRSSARCGAGGAAASAWPAAARSKEQTKAIRDGPRRTASSSPTAAHPDRPH
jgi:hypothetical protein